MTTPDLLALLKAAAAGLVEEINRNQASGLLSRKALILTSRLEQALWTASAEPEPTEPQTQGEPL